MSAREDDYEEESNPSRRSVLAVLGLTGAATVGSAWWVTDYLSGRDESDSSDGNDHHHHDDGHDHDYPQRDNGGGPNDEYTPSPADGEIDDWDDILPGDCHLSTDEQEWLVSRIDADNYDNMNSENFFEYVEDGKIRMYESNGELRMEVDEDYSGGEFTEDGGYNIPDAC